MTDINNWILDNLVLAILLNIVLGAAFIFILMWCGYTLFKKHRLSPLEWVVLGAALTFGVIAYMLTGMSESPVSL